MNEKEAEVRKAFRQQAEFCRGLGSPITAEVLNTAADKLSGDTETGKRILFWDGDPTAGGDNVTLRLAGGLHAVARSGDDERLAAAYRGEGDVSAAVEAALVEHDAALLPWLDTAPQTNEAGRAAVVMAGLLVAADRFPLPIDLLELGSSAGLVLNLARYRYDLGGREAGEPTSPLLLRPSWTGAPPPDAPVDIITQRGVDRSPVYLSTPAAEERLTAYIWPDQRQRLETVEAAIRLARAFTPPVIQGEAADWTEKRLAQPQADGVMRILFHTIAFQYFPDDQKDRVRVAIEAAGAAATEDRPFGWLSFEFDEAKNACELHLTLWPTGEKYHLANAHPHATSVSWKG